MGNPRLVIFLRGGLIQDICASETMEVVILDYDTEGCDKAKEIVEWDFGKGMPRENDREVIVGECFDEVFDIGPWSPGVHPMAVEHYFK